MDFPLANVKLSSMVVCSLWGQSIKKMWMFLSPIFLSLKDPLPWKESLLAKELRCVAMFLAAA